MTLFQTYGQLKNETIQTTGNARMNKDPEIKSPLKKSKVFLGADFLVRTTPTTNPIQRRIQSKIRMNP